MKSINYILITIFILISITIFQQNSIAQIASPSNDQNYVQSITLREATLSGSASSIGSKEHIQTVEYIDGLGRPLQIQQVKQSPSEKTVITPIVYDEVGRTPKTHLPTPTAVTSSTFFDNNTMVPFAVGMYNALFPNEGTPYSEKGFEDSPLNRVMQQAAPGDNWNINSTHTVDFEYTGNSQASDNVLRWKVDGTGIIGPYPTGTLHKTVVTNENGHQTIEFKDKLDRLVLKRRVLTANNFADTYYVYDEFGNVIYVIPPEAVAKMLQTNNFDATAGQYFGLVFAYQYDERQRQITKRAPGEKGTYLVYDKLDRPILTQDGNMNEDDFWEYTKYDVLGRPVITGLFYRNISRANLQNDVNSTNFANTYSLYEEKLSSSTHGYTNNTYPPINQTDVLTVTYYDDYGFNANGLQNYLPDPSFVDTHIAISQGKMTGQKIAILDPQNVLTEEWLYTTFFYDKFGRIVQQRSTNHLGGEYTTYASYNFAGEMTHEKMLYQHTPNYDEIIITKRYDYDHTGRLKNVFLKFDNEAEILLAEHNYDEIGQLIEKNLHSENGGSSFLQSIDYTYNIRGWLTKINEVEIGGGNRDPKKTHQNALEDCKSNLSINALDIYRLSKEKTYGSSSETTEMLLPVLYFLLQESEQSTIESSTLSLADEQTVSELFDLFNQQNWSYNNRLLSINDLTNQEFNLVHLLDLFNELGANPSNFTRTQQYGRDGIKNKKFRKLFELFTHITEPEQAKIYTAYYQQLEQLLLNYVEEQCKEIVNELTQKQTSDNQKSSANSSTEQDDLFNMEIHYNNGISGLQGADQHNGNISAVVWRSKGDDEIRGYGFSYDPLDRILKGKYAGKYTGSSNWQKHVNRYTVDGITYDLNGNILTLNRKSNTGPSGNLDQLAYTYANNRLKKVTDNVTGTDAGGFIDGANSTTEYTYDKNGNVITDLNKKLNIEYNHLNLPDRITPTNGSTNTGSVIWIYDALGNKLQKRQLNASGNLLHRKDYGNGFEYKNGAFEAYYHEEGRITNEGAPNQRISNIQYEYTLKDHLGNGRVYFCDSNDDGVPEILQESHYYPFGLSIEALADNGNPNNQYQYNGKERNEELGLDWLDYGARWYDPQLARWGSVDPLAGHPNQVDKSAYAYAWNNPVYYTDPTGLAPWIQETDEEGNISFVAEPGDNVETFIEQYNITPEQTIQIFDEACCDGMQVSFEEGETIHTNLDSPLKLNYTNSTGDQKASQLVFAFQYTKTKGEYSFDLKDFYFNITRSTGLTSNPQFAKGFKGNVDFKGTDIPLNVIDFPNFEYKYHRWTTEVSLHPTQPIVPNEYNEYKYWFGGGSIFLTVPGKYNDLFYENYRSK